MVSSSRWSWQRRAMESRTSSTPSSASRFSTLTGRCTEGVAACPDDSVASSFFCSYLGLVSLVFDWDDRSAFWKATEYVRVRLSYRSYSRLV